MHERTGHVTVLALMTRITVSWPSQPAGRPGKPRPKHLKMVRTGAFRMADDGRHEHPQVPDFEDTASVHMQVLFFLSCGRFFMAWGRVLAISEQCGSITR